MPLSGARSRAERVFGPPSSQPGSIGPTLPRARRSAWVSPRWTPSTRVGVITAAAESWAGGEAMRDGRNGHQTGGDEQKYEAERAHARKVLGAGGTQTATVAFVHLRDAESLRQRR